MPDRQEYIEKLSNNAMKGEHYILKLYNDPVLYVAIPYMRSGITGKENEFLFKVLEPGAAAGVFKRSISDIEFMTKQ